MKKYLLPFIIFPLLSCHICSVNSFHTLKRNRINFAIKQTSTEDLNITITNRGYKRLNPIDSLSFFFYKDNANLYSPVSDSLRMVYATKNKLLIYWADFVQPVDFYHLKYKKISYNDTVIVPASSLIEAVMNKGTPDNKNQLFSRFQIFCKGFYKRKLQFLVPSDYFRIQKDK